MAVVWRADADPERGRDVGTVVFSISSQRRPEPDLESNGGVAAIRCPWAPVIVSISLHGYHESSFYSR
jgi:hypothetical protein